jgi:hypothetical protein
MKLPQFSPRDVLWPVLAGNPELNPKDVAIFAGVGLCALIAAALRLVLVHFDVNKWVRSIVAVVVFFALSAGWVLLAWKFWL